MEVEIKSIKFFLNSIFMFTANVTRRPVIYFKSRRAHEVNFRVWYAGLSGDTAHT